MPEPIAIARPMPVTRLLSASLALMLLVACGKAPPSAPPPPPEVSVAEVVSREITEWDEYTGHLEAKDTVEIRPQISGVLQRIAFIEGKEVKKGDLLFQI
ncbi:MAG TPA: biotin/lipoyl-binding protein, partial [Steroidobacteraceae bacterium]|nr:biotin/lipoyl-binding protein [Steroidobacteraceae bacterium]